MINTVRLLVASCLLSTPAAAQLCGSLRPIEHEFAPSPGDLLELVDCSVGAGVVVATGSEFIFSGVRSQSYRWTQQGGLVRLNAGGPDSWVTALSNDGNWACGYAPEGFGNSSQTQHACRWDSGGGIQYLDIGGNIQSEATAISANGSVVVGEAVPMGPFTGRRPFRWSPSTGMVILDRLPGGAFGRALAVSGDGQSVFGLSEIQGGGNRLVRWLGSGPPIDIGPGDAVVNGVSFFGDRAVGEYDTPAGRRGFIWTAAGGLQQLPDASGQPVFAARDITDSGEFIVGVTLDPSGGGARIYRYSAAGGYELLATDEFTTSVIKCDSFRAEAIVGGNLVWRQGAASVWCGQDRPSTCTTTLFVTGQASLSSGLPLSPTLFNVPSSTFGLLFIALGSMGRTPTSFGDLCASGPYVRLPVQPTGGSAMAGSCNGVLSTDVNGFLASSPGLGLQIGDQVVAQYWYRDPSTPSGASFSSAVSIPVCP